MVYGTSYLCFSKHSFLQFIHVLHVLNVSCELFNSVGNSFGSRTTGITEDLMSSSDRISARLAVERRAGRTFQIPEKKGRSSGGEVGGTES